MAAELADAEAIGRLDGPLLALLATRLRAYAQLLRDVARTVVRVPERWCAAGRAAFERAAGQARARFLALADTLETVGLLVSVVSAEWQTVQGEAIAAARVLAADGDPGGAAAGQLGIAIAAFEDADRRAAAGVREAMFGGPLASARPGAFPGPVERAAGLAEQSATPTPLPEQPAAVAVWWAGLSAASRARLSGWPILVGGLDGVPAAVRDTLNRRRLAAALASAESEGRAHRVQMLRAVALTLARQGSELLSFDADGDGQAVVASGDIEAARSVAVVVPGMDTDLDDVPRLTGQALTLVGAAGAGTVAVTWLGYDAPSPLQVISDAKARGAAPLLTRFVSGVRAVAAAHQHLTVIGHSYGTLVAGLAARRPLAADDLVLLASPGVEATSARELHVPPGHAWAARAPTDPIGLVFWPTDLARRLGVRLPYVFGPDPTRSAFGARTFSVAGARGHSGYFTTGSGSLRSLAGIVRGIGAVRGVAPGALPP